MTTTSCAATIADSEACETQTTCDDQFPSPCNALAACP
jgi:hypothetical protein